MIQKNKNRLLLLGFLLALLACYHLAFSKTIEVKKQLNSLTKQSVNFKNITKLSTNLYHREKYVDSVLKKNNFKNLSIQNNLLEFLNQQSQENKFLITDFIEPHDFIKDNATITSYQFTIKGDFNSLLGVVYSLEQNYNFGKITHINFEKKRDYRKRKDELLCFVVLENLFSE